MYKVKLLKHTKQKNAYKDIALKPNVLLEYLSFAKVGSSELSAS
jgi:hypothetical protein